MAGIQRCGTEFCAAVYFTQTPVFSDMMFSISIVNLANFQNIIKTNIFVTC